MNSPASTINAGTINAGVINAGATVRLVRELFLFGRQCNLPPGTCLKVVYVDRRFNSLKFLVELPEGVKGHNGGDVDVFELLPKYSTRCWWVGPEEVELVTLEPYTALDLEVSELRSRVAQLETFFASAAKAPDAPCKENWYGLKEGDRVRFLNDTVEGTVLALWTKTNAHYSDYGAVVLFDQPCYPAAPRLQPAAPCRLVKV